MPEPNCRSVFRPPQDLAQALRSMNQTSVPALPFGQLDPTRRARRPTVAFPAQSSDQQRVPAMPERVRVFFNETAEPLITNIRILCFMNRRARVHLREAHKLVGLAESMAVLADMLDLAQSDWEQAHFGRQHQGDTELKQRARELSNATREAVNAISPLEDSHPEFHRRRIRRARQLIGTIEDPALSQALIDLMSDDSVHLAWKVGTWNRVADLLTVATHEIEQTPAQERLSQTLARSIRQDNNCVVDTILSGASVFEKSIKFAFNITRIVAARRIIDNFRSASACGRDAQGLLDDVWRWARHLNWDNAYPEASGDAAVHARERVGRVLRDGNPTEVDELRGEIRNAVHAGWLDVVFDGLTAVQALWTLAKPGDDIPDQELAHALEAGSAITDLGSVSMKLLSWGADRTARLGGFKAVFKMLGLAFETCGNALTCAGAVYSIYKGCTSISEGFSGREIDAGKIVLGGIEIASSVIAIVGVFCATPGLQVAGVVVGLVGWTVSEIMEDDRPLNARIYAQLLDGFSDLESDGEQTRDGDTVYLIERLNLTQPYERLRAAADAHARWELQFVFPTAVQNAQTMRARRSMARYMRRRLRQIGLRRVANQMVAIP